MMRKITTILFALWLLMNIAFADVIKNYEVVITVLKSGKIDVVETIEMDIDHKDVRLGIIRDIPRRYSMYKQEIETPIEVLSVTRNGESENYWVKENDDLFEIYTGAKYDHFQNYIPKGKNIYQFHWQSTNHIRGFHSYDELYFNAIGNGWQFSIEQAKVTLVLPNSVKAIQSAGYYGQSGDSTKATVTEISSQKIEFTAPKIIGNGEGLTIATGFTKGIIPSVPIGKIEGWVEEILNYFPPYFQPVHIVFLGIVLLMWGHWLVGYVIYLFRIPRSSRAFMVQFAPPNDLTLDQVMALNSSRFFDDNDRFATAFLADLAHKNVISFHPKDKEIVMNKRSKWLPDQNLTRGEKEFLSVLGKIPNKKLSYQNNNSVLQNSLKTMLGSVEKFSEEYYRVSMPYFGLSAFILFIICIVISASMIPANLLLIMLFPFCGCLLISFGLTQLLKGFSWDNILLKLGSFGLYFVFGLVAGGLPLTLLGIWGDFGFPAITKASIVIILIMLCFYFVTYQYSKIRFVIKAEYIDLQQQVWEFKHFLAYTKDEEYKFLTPDLFEEYLPFAIALGVDHRWLKLYQKSFPNEYKMSFKYGGIAARSISRSTSFRSSSVTVGTVGAGRSSGSGGGGSSGGGSGGGGGRGR